jgi:HAD superfamily hydrolase (TIGR01490 family)
LSSAVDSATAVALFDLDHTLIPFDSDYEWGQFTTRLGWTDADVFAAKNTQFYQDYQAGSLDIHAYVRFATEAFRRQGRVVAESARERFMEEWVMSRIRPEALALIEAHRQAGDLLAVVTATNAFITRPIAHALGIGQLIAVELQVENGWFNGEIAGTPSFREGKVVRVEQWLASLGLSLGTARCTFYSDSANDLPLLSAVTRPVATNPDARLRSIATERNWAVLDLFGTY